MALSRRSGVGKFRGPGRKGTPAHRQRPCIEGVITGTRPRRQSGHTRRCRDAALSLAKPGRAQVLSIRHRHRLSQAQVPFVWYDILHVVEVLSRFPFVHADARFREMVEGMTAQADEQGRYTATSIYRARRVGLLPTRTAVALAHVRGASGAKNDLVGRNRMNAAELLDIGSRSGAAWSKRWTSSATSSCALCLAKDCGRWHRRLPHRQRRGGWFRHVVTQELGKWPPREEERYSTIASVKALLDEVHQRTDSYLTTVDVADLDQVIAAPWGEEFPCDGRLACAGNTRFTTGERSISCWG